MCVQEQLSIVFRHVQTVPVALVVVCWILKPPIIVSVLACTKPFVDVTMGMLIFIDFSKNRRHVSSRIQSSGYPLAIIAVAKAQAGFLIFAATAAVPLPLLDAISGRNQLMTFGTLRITLQKCSSSPC